MKRAITRTATVALVTLSLVLPAGSTAVAGDRSPRGSEVHRVKMPGSGANRFAPATITIDRGDRVKWVNKDSVTHTTTSNDGDWDSTMSAGDSFTRRFRQEGTFRYHCTIHPEMTGTIIVS